MKIIQDIFHSKNLKVAYSCIKNLKENYILNFIILKCNSFKSNKLNSEPNKPNGVKFWIKKFSHFGLAYDETKKLKRKMMS